jgi:pimeloyl-ACP methyl ester carboxylesterase
MALSRLEHLEARIRMIPRHEDLYRVNGIELCAETFGNRADPAILLLMGATASMVWWPEELCLRLAARGRFVIRYDQRDTGRSHTYEPGAPPYSVDDLASDALGLLDALGIDVATLVGMSLGGYVAQIVALQAPERVRSLVLIASEPLGPGDPSIPGIDPALLEYHTRAASLDWSDLDAVVEYQVGGWRLLSGSARPFDEPLVRAMATRDAQRARSPLSAFNHAQLGGGERWFGRLAEIRQPVLVIHGTDDRVLRFAHAQALVRDIPGAELLALEGAGHELHPLDWEAIVEGILRM